uniref:Trigger factor ribosome-binding bacterial domain-containing protein n=1 Tax=Quercus lobata TaxID=97700 RepID=A0A7N2N9W6_QUELO
MASITTMMMTTIPSEFQRQPRTFTSKVCEMWLAGVDAVIWLPAAKKNCNCMDNWRAIRAVKAFKVVGLLLGDMKVTCLAPFVRVESKSHNYLCFECSFSMIIQFSSLLQQSCHVTIGCSHVLTCPKSTCTNFCDMQHYLCRSLLFPSSPQRRGLTRLTKPISASSSGLEASITDQKGKTIKLKSAMIVIESQDENKMQIQVDLTGDETEKVFNQVLTNLARTAPPVPGFRRQKGGKILISLANVVQVITMLCVYSL